MKTIRLLAAVLLAASAIPAFALRTSTVNGITWTYTVSNGEAFIGGGTSSHPAVPKSTDGDLLIPSSLDGYPVTGIDRYAFYGCSGLTSVTIPDSVTSIGERAFLHCSGLTSVTMPDSVTSIGRSAFYDCHGLTSVHISDIRAWCRISFFDSMSNPLRHAHNLYLNGEQITNLTIPDSITSVKPFAFCSCSSLTSVTIPDSVTSIGEGAFYFCTRLTSLAIPDSVTNVEDSVFALCFSLTSVTIPDSVVSIGSSAFASCGGLTSFYVSKDNPAYSSVNELLLSKDGKSLIAGISGEASIPDSVTSIGDYAFSGRGGFTSMTIPDSVTSIGSYVFASCGGLTSVTMPDSVTSIGDYAFSCCSRLTSVKMPNSVTSIGDYAFNNCSGLTSVTIPDSVTSIGYAAFADCDGLTSVTIPDTVTNIVGGAFSRCTSLTSVTIPDSVTSIGDYAFNNCSGLTSVTIPDSVTSIGDGAFYGCSGLTSVTIPDSVTSIGDGAFCGCSGLTSVTMLGDAPEISDYAFSEVSSECIVHLPIGNKTYTTTNDEWGGMTVAWTVVAPPKFDGCEKSWVEWFKTLEQMSKKDSTTASEVVLTVTNVVVHYVTTAAVSEAVTPSEDVGFVNIISEVHAGAAVAISSEWATQYGQAFTAKFGSDFTKAVTALTGKRDGAGNAMQVWQDFVAGTDPTDENDVFTASITFDADGKPQIAYSPKFENEAEAAKRKYTTYGKVKLTDKDWTEIPVGEEDDYNFFKVTVEMR